MSDRTLSTMLLQYMLWVILMFSSAYAFSQQWHTSSSGPGDFWLDDMTIDSQGAIYTAGYFSGLEILSTDSSQILLPAVDDYDGVLVKHDEFGNYLWSITLQGQGHQGVRGIDVNSTDEVVISGRIEDTVDFDMSNGEHYISSQGATSYIASYASDRDLLWAKAFHASGLDCHIHDLIIDSQDNVLITGSFSGSMDADPDSGVVQLTALGQSDGFIIKLDRDGEFIWAKTFQGPSNVLSRDLLIDADGNIIISGTFNGQADLDTSEDYAVVISEGDVDIFICKLDQAGNTLWSGSIGGTGTERPYELAMDSEQSIYLSGMFGDACDMDMGDGIHLLHSTGNMDAMLIKMDMDGNFQWAHSLGGSLVDIGHAVKVDMNDRIIWAGQYWGSVDMEVGIEEHYQSSLDVMDFFILEFDTEGNQTATMTQGGMATEMYPLITLTQDEDLLFAGSFSGNCDTDPSSSFFPSEASGYD
ncbi:MAG: hypothetical protein HKN79_07245, partial [Flavobacteriales bacterium]|nr:hypothetical protein [Flavobacteriales bacterium]